MSQNLDSLNELICSGCVNPNDFYIIRMDGDLILQGYANKKNKKKYKCSFSLKKSKTSIGWFEGIRCDVKMTLTT